MKNNKGYYSWIHSLNEAAVKSQVNGQKMLHEQKKEKDILETTPESLVQGGGNLEIYKEIFKQKQLEAIAKKTAINLDVEDFNNDGIKNTKDVLDRNAADASDGVPDTRFGPQYSPQFTNPLGAEARLEMGQGVPGDEELAKGGEPFHVTAARLAQMERDYEAKKETEEENTEGEIDRIMRGKSLGESLNQKILRILREEEETVRKQSDKPKSRRGSVVKGFDERPTYAGSPRSQNAPEGMFKGTESAEQRLGKILAVVRDGPKKHGNAAYSWASNALETMQKTLRKD